MHIYPWYICLLDCVCVCVCARQFFIACFSLKNFLKQYCMNMGPFFYFFHELNPKWLIDKIYTFLN